MIYIKKDLVSIIFPFYNVEDYIEEAIESILDQTYKNLEIVIVNDGSKDNSKNRIQKYLKKYNNIKYIEHENKGLAESRNVGLRNSSGEFIMFIDSDDFIDNKMVELMYQNIKKNKSNVCISGYYLYYEGNNVKTKAVLPNISGNVIRGNSNILNNILDDKLKCYSCMKLFKRDIINKVNFNFEKGKLYEDFLPTLKLLTQADIISIVNKPLYYYRQRSNSITQKKNIKVIADYVYTIENVFDYINESNFEVNKKSMDKFNIDTFSNLIRKYFRNSNKNPRLMLIEDGNKKYEVSLMKLLNNKNTVVNNKIICLLWKLRLDWLLKKVF